VAEAVDSQERATPLYPGALSNSLGYDDLAAHMRSTNCRLGVLSGKTIKVATLVFALGLFLSNKLAFLAGSLHTPAGYSFTNFSRDEGVAAHVTWIRAFQDRVFIPNYQAPYVTEPAHFHPWRFLLARATKLAGVDIATGYHFAHLLYYVLTAYALLFAIRVFTASKKQALGALFIALCVVPLKSLVLLPAFLLGLDIWRDLPGLSDYFWWSADGFFHGISGSVMATFGTGITLLAMGLLARYLQTNEKRYLTAAGAAAFLSAFFHPMEVCVIVGAGSLTLLLRKGRQWIRASREVAVLSLPGAAGLAVHIIPALRYQWLYDAAQQLRWSAVSPLHLLLMLGLPAILVAVLFFIRTRMASPSDLLLQCWFWVTLIGIYIPWVPWSQHFLDGFHYATALLLVRQGLQIELVRQMWRSYPRLAASALIVCSVLSLVPHVFYRIQSFDRLLTTLAPEEEIALIHWMRQNAKPDQLVLAPLENAPWLATVPMHSFASHRQLSSTFQEQARLSGAFYGGTMKPEEALRFIKEYGVTYVVVPEASPALQYLTGYQEKAWFGSLAVFELPGNFMKPYPGKRR
jgi:hypothetical protein